MPNAEKEAQARVKFPIATTARWGELNPVLLDGEVGFEVTAGGTIFAKVGDGETAWGSLPYFSAHSANQLATARTIDGINFNGTADISHFAVCSTAADVAEKAVSCAGFTKRAGAWLVVTFSATNTADNATLNVNNTGAAPIYYQGSAIGKSQLAAGRFRLFIYDGTNYEFVGDVNTTHNTFSGATANANGAKGLVPQPVAGDQAKFLMGNATWGNLPTMQGATDQAGGSAGMVPAPIAGQDEYFLKGNGSWGLPSGSGSGAAGNYGQVTKTNVTASANAPKTVRISLPRSTRFQYAPPSVLLFEAGSEGVVETACDFNNGDAGDFDYTSKYVGFDGTMHLDTEYLADMGTSSVLGTGYLFASEQISQSEYKSMESVKAGGGQAVGIALVASGGGSGTWATFEENCTALLIFNGAAYDCAGNLMAANWANLSDSDKVTAFEDADGGDSIPLALHLSHDITMSAPTAVADGYVSTSNSITASSYETIEDVEVGGGKAVGIALVTSGGGSGTWARVEENSTAILIASTGAAYDFDGNELAADWDELTDAEKEDAFGDAEGDDPTTVMGTLGTFQFAVYSTSNIQPTCTIYEEKTVSTFSVVMYSMNSTAPTCTITAVPKDQLVKPDGLMSLADYEAINSVTMTATATGNAIIRYAVTPDLTSYYTYDATNGVWVSVAATAAGVLADGMTAAEVAAVPAEAWATLTGTNEEVGFAYALSMTDVEESCYVDAVTLDVDMKGTWRGAVNGTDYTYGYPNNTCIEFSLYASGNWKINYDAG